jgi:hypothetical protein
MDNSFYQDSAYVRGLLDNQEQRQTQSTPLKITVSPVRVRVPPLLLSSLLQGKLKHKRDRVLYRGSLTTIARDWALEQIVLKVRLRVARHVYSRLYEMADGR